MITLLTVMKYTLKMVKVLSFMRFLPQFKKKKQSRKMISKTSKAVSDIIPPSTIYFCLDFGK